jgi:hypothetical protein
MYLCMYIYIYMEVYIFTYIFIFNFFRSRQIFGDRCKQLTWVPFEADEDPNTTEGDHWGLAPETHPAVLLYIPALYYYFSFLIAILVSTHIYMYIHIYIYLYIYIYI